jgi:hypothetical protein
MAAMRTSERSSRLARHTVTFDYANNFNVTAGLAGRIRGIGLDCGGAFRDFESLKFHYDIEFFD